MDRPELKPYRRSFTNLQDRSRADDEVVSLVGDAERIAPETLPTLDSRRLDEP
jgi:hypothetical protein